MNIVKELSYVADRCSRGSHPEDAHNCAIAADYIEHLEQQVHQQKYTILELTRMVEELRNRKRPKEPCGPWGIVKLQNIASDVIYELEQLTTKDELETYLEDEAVTLRHIETDLPTWWDGPYGEPNRGLKARIERAKERCNADR